MNAIEELVDYVTASVPIYKISVGMPVIGLTGVSKSHSLYHAPFIRNNELYDYPMVMLNPTVIVPQHQSLGQKLFCGS